jgi:hypothetical protein
VEATVTDLVLTSQEQKIVDYHRNTIKGGGVGEDQRGRPVTVYTTTIPTGRGDEHANVPGYVGGKIRNRKELQKLFKDEIAEGRWPVYKTGKEADARAKEVHQIMDEEAPEARGKKRNKVKAFKKGGKVSSASSRADGIAQRGKTRGKIV